jgi:hypothetical protein
MAQILQRPLYARVPPPWILRGHPHDEAPNLGEHHGAPWAPPRVRPFPYNQFAMPSKNGVGRHERCHVSQYGPSETLSEHGQAPALRIVQPQSTSGQCAFSARFSSRRNAITSRWSRSSHPNSAASSICNGFTPVSRRECVVRVFRHYARTLVALALLTGLRGGELFALRWWDVDEANRSLQVRAAVYEGVFDDPKTTAGLRTIPLPDAALRLLAAWKARTKTTAAHELIFSIVSGKPISPNNVFRRWLASV